MANLVEKIKTNVELVAQLKNKIKQGEDNHAQYKASINALELNNEIMAYFEKSKDGEAPAGECLSRVYALLQTLFVSIDALYSLNILLTRNKNNININQNRQLRELKYIRNDVVGHPVNRIFANDEVGFCVLKKNDITKKSFRYHIYFEDTIKKREVIVNSLIDSYYEEANKFLERLVSYKDDKNDEIFAKIKRIAIKLQADEEIREEILQLRSLYISKYPAQAKTDVRFMWRVEILMRLRTFLDPKDKEIKEIINYASGYQLTKLSELIQSYDAINEKSIVPNKLREPKGLSQIDKLADSNPVLAEAIKNLHDMTHPLFNAGLDKLIAACNKDTPYALKYLTQIKKFKEMGESDMVYCLGVVVKNHRK